MIELLIVIDIAKRKAPDADAFQIYRKILAWRPEFRLTKSAILNNYNPFVCTSRILIRKDRVFGQADK